MANRNFSRVQALNKEIKIIAGRLEDDDTRNAGLGWTGANSATGTYVITLADKYNALISCTAMIQSTTGVDNFNITIASHDVTSAQTITFHTTVDDGYGLGVLTDLGDTDEIHFNALLQNSAVPSV